MNTNTNNNRPSFTRRVFALTACALGVLIFGAPRAAQAAGPKPTISSFSPASGPVGTVVTLNGANFDRDKNGNVWTGSTPPYRAVFAMSGGTATATVTFVSSTKIKATVPNGAVTAPIRLGQGFTNFAATATNFTVTAPPPPPPAQTILKIVNNVQYNMVDLRLGNQQQFGVGQGVLAGHTVNLTVQPGNFTLNAGVGFFNADGTRDIWFTFSRTVSIISGQTTTVTFNRITVPQLLTMGPTFRDWQGDFFDNNGGFHLARYRFFSNGTWTKFVDNVQVASGNVTEVSWANSASTVQFRVSSPLPVISLGFPFGSFMLRDGPASWPIIQYTRQ